MSRARQRCLVNVRLVSLISWKSCPLQEESQIFWMHISRISEKLIYEMRCPREAPVSLFSSLLGTLFTSAPASSAPFEQPCPAICPRMFWEISQRTSCRKCIFIFSSPPKQNSIFIFSSPPKQNNLVQRNAGVDAPLQTEPCQDCPVLLNWIRCTCDVYM